MDVTVRVATAADAAKLAAFAERVFRETFEKDTTPEDMDAYLRSAFTPALQAEEIADPTFSVLLALASDGELAAYAEIAHNPVPPEVGDTTSLELARFYLAKEWQGSGLARRLMQEVMREANRRGARTLWLGVWEHNARAIAFYTKQGYRIVGSHPFVLGSDHQTDLVMVAVVDRSGVDGSGEKPA